MSLSDELRAILDVDRIDLARAALVIAKIEMPALDPGPSLVTLDRLGARALERLRGATDRSPRAKVAALNALLFDDEGFAGNREYYADFRNSFLNVVLERRRGIPITLALVYMEVARRSGVEVRGVAFPGHFLMRVGDMILDPFDAGAELSQAGCLSLLGRHTDATDDEVALDPALLAPCTPRQMLARILNNLKRAYIDLRSFPQARMVADLLLTVDPTLQSELRDRGLLSYHLDDFPSALRDLEDYARLNLRPDESDAEERQQIREHIAALRRRVAGMN